MVPESIVKFFVAIFPSATFQLGAFTSFFEAMFALNLAFSIWRKLIQSFVETQRAEVKKELLGNRDKGAQGTSVDLKAETLKTAYLDQEKANKKNTDKIIKKGQKLSRYITILMLLTLLLVGFFPDFELSWVVILLLAFVLPVPIWTYFYTVFLMRKWGNKATKQQEELERILDDMLG